MSTEERVLAFVAAMLRDVERTPADGVHRELSLLASGLLDSHGTLELAAWIEEEIGGEVDLTTLDLAAAWDTPALIAAFIERQR